MQLDIEENNVLEQMYTVELKDYKEARDKRKREKVQAFPNEFEDNIEKSILDLKTEDRDKLRKSIINFGYSLPNSNRERPDDAFDAIINQLQEKRNDSNFMGRLQEFLARLDPGDNHLKEQDNYKSHEYNKTRFDSRRSGNTSEPLLKRGPFDQSRKSKDNQKNTHCEEVKEEEPSPTKVAEREDNKTKDLALPSALLEDQGLIIENGSQKPKGDLHLDFDLNQFNTYNSQVAPISEEKKQTCDPASKTLNNEGSRRGDPLEDMFKTDDLGLGDFDNFVDDHTVTLRIKSSFEGANQVGFTSLKLYDKKGKEINLTYKNAILRGYSQARMNNAFNDDFYTTEHLRMMMLDFPLLADHLDFQIQYKGVAPGCLRIWNYNAVPIKGIKECSVLLDGEKIQSLQLERAPGGIYEFYNQDVVLNDEAIIPNCPSPPKKKIAQPIKSQPPKPSPILEKEEDEQSNRREMLITDSLLEDQFKGSGVKGFKDLFSAEGPQLDDLIGNQVKESSSFKKPRVNSRRTQSRQSSNVQINFKASFSNTAKEINQGEDSESSTQRNVNSRRTNRKITANEDQPPNPYIDNNRDLRISDEFDSILKQQKVNLEESQLLEKEALIIPAKDRFAFKKKNVPSLGEEDILDMEFNNTLRNLEKFNRNNLSRMLASQELTPNNTLQKFEFQQLQMTGGLTDKREMGLDDLIKSCSDFSLPIIPSGRILEMRIYSTWGDKYYVGMAGLEVFDSLGRPVQISPNGIEASPSDLNSLPGYHGDPRTIDKLVDGNYKTCDEIHSWLAPFYEESPNKIRIDLQSSLSLSMIRLWNYNKNRIHSSRGARIISLFLDGSLIFFGEISKAPGNLTEAEESAECIIFMDEGVYQNIEKNDWIGKTAPPSEMNRIMESRIERPSTSNARQTFTPNTQLSDIKKKIEMNKKILEDLEREQNQKDQKANEALQVHTGFIECRKMTITILETWGDDYYSGLNGIRFYDHSGNEIIIQENMLSAKPRDVRSEGNPQDVRVLENLIRGENLTTDTKHMWLAPFDPGNGASVFFNFGKAVKISKAVIWNYNKDIYDISRGVKRVSIIADLKEITPKEGLYLRKAPGTSFTEFGQVVLFPISQKLKGGMKFTQYPKCDQFSVPPALPSGFHIRIHILSTWGDSYYVGMNGLDIYNQKGKSIMKDTAIAADPRNLAACGNNDDIRDISNLTTGVNLNSDDKDIWLAPYINPRIKGDSNLGRESNRIFIDFCKPETISCIRFWNYTKTPARGVREIEIYIDDHIVFTGILRQSGLGGSNETAVVFTGNKLLIDKIGANTYYEVSGQPMAYSNEGMVRFSFIKLELWT